MKKLQKDMKKLEVLNEVMEGIKKDIVKSISIDDKFIPLNFNEDGTLHVNEHGFLRFIETFNPEQINQSKCGSLTVFDFYNDDIKICTLLYDEEIKKFMNEFYKLLKKDYIKTNIIEEIK